MFEDTFKKDDHDMLREAEDYFRKAYQLQIKGQIDEAIELYLKSIDAFPTAEAHTFLGWAYSYQGHYDAAIAACEEAIAVDPDFGNPYNDIGAYMISLDQLDEAVPWLEKAKLAKRYEARHYPFFNLGRIYEKLGQWDRALEEYQGALKIYPEYDSAKTALQRLNLLLSRRN